MRGAGRGIDGNGPRRLLFAPCIHARWKNEAAGNLIHSRKVFNYSYISVGLLPYVTVILDLVGVLRSVATIRLIKVRSILITEMHTQMNTSILLVNDHAHSTQMYFKAKAVLM
jgi:hypothetical protein